MSQSVLIRAAGLYSFPNHLSSVPPGALLKAKNVNINRDNIIEPSRGFAIYGSEAGTTTTDIIHQFGIYKGRIFRHWGDGVGSILDYDSDASGTFSGFSIIITGTTHSNTTIDGIISTSQLLVGMSISGTGIAPGTSISSITDNNTLVISIAATASATVALTFVVNVSEIDAGLRIKSIESNGNFYFTTSQGIKKISAANAADLSSAIISDAGMPPALDLKATINSITTGFFTNDNSVGYRMVWGINDANQNLILGTPSSRVVLYNSFSTSATVNLTFSIPQGITTADFYQVYRTALISGANDPGDEQQLVYEANPTNSDLNNGFIKINDITPDSFRGANLYTNPNTGDGILQSNDRPPLAKDITSFKNYIFYANTQTRQQKQINLLSVAALVSGTSTLTITDGTTSNTYTFVTGVAEVTTFTAIANTAHALAGRYVTINSASNETQYYIWFYDGTGVDPAIAGKTGIKVTIANGDSDATVAGDVRTILAGYSDFVVTGATNQFILTNSSVGIAIDATAGTSGFAVAINTQGVGEDFVNKKILISALSTVAQKVDDTARSIVRVINRNSAEIVYAYYLSGPTDVPGQILFQEKTLGAATFYFNVDSTATGGEFDPTLPISGNSVISDNEAFANRIYYSKLQQPDAVPILNTIDVGARDKKILRILALRDNLFVLKEEGIFRISGLIAPFTLSLFDSSTLLKAPDSAVVLNNLIYCYSSQGVATISDTGVSVVSRPIEDKLIKLTTANFTNFSTATFGVSYESDRSYYLYTVSVTTDVYATQVYKYNTFTNTWTEGSGVMGEKRAGVVNSSDDRLYLAPTDTNFIERERKNFDRTDFANREIPSLIAASSVNGTQVILPNVIGILSGDVLIQTQYLTIAQINQLLHNLDNDSILSDANYFATLGAAAGAELNTLLDNVITKISADAGRLAASGHTSAATYTALIPSSSDFASLQSNYNSLISLLINDNGTGTKNYFTSSSTSIQEIIIDSVNGSTNTVTLEFAYPLIQGPITIYNYIDCEIIWAPQFMQDPSMTKQVSEGTLIFEDSSYSKAVISYATDLSPSQEEIPFTGDGNGSYGNFIYGEGIYGGNGSAAPFRTYIPLEKQRCRYINARFTHSVAREQFSIYGLSLTFNMVSQRGYR